MPKSNLKSQANDQKLKSTQSTIKRAHEKFGGGDYRRGQGLEYDSQSLK
jgi:hypothetical protein